MHVLYPDGIQNVFHAAFSVDDGSVSSEVDAVVEAEYWKIGGAAVVSPGTIAFAVNGPEVYFADYDADEGLNVTDSVELGVDGQPRDLIFHDGELVLATQEGLNLSFTKLDTDGTVIEGPFATGYQVGSYPTPVFIPVPGDAIGAIVNPEEGSAVVLTFDSFTSAGFEGLNELSGDDFGVGAFERLLELVG